jgi:23S rRNA A2030 N6-methylase RlmJ
MANAHFAEIGDVWKHLPLAEVLAIERPDRYWETHAGSALYPLTPSPERSYGVYRVLGHAGRFPAVDRSVYLRVLRELGSGRPGGRYPGSPYLAMSVLGTTAREYRLAETDPVSLGDLRAAGRLVGPGRVTVVDGDGVAAVLHASAGLDPASGPTTFALVDPYQALQPTTAGLSPAELWARLARRGGRTMLWYGFETTADHAQTSAGLLAALDRAGVDPGRARLWAGEITVAGFGAHPVAWNPGVPGCGIACANLGDRSVAACEALGAALQALYAGARTPAGADGSLSFRAVAW